MLSSLRYLLVGFSISCLDAADTCRGDACDLQPEDESLMQLDRLGVQADLHMALPEGDKSSFVLNSKPYLQDGRAVTGTTQDRIVINEDGELNTYYLPGASVDQSGMTVSLRPPHRFYLMKRPTTDYSEKDNFYMPSLLGKTFSVDIDMTRSGPSCGCYLTIYLVGMPAPTPGYYKDYYCDSSCLEGLGCCAEFNLNEGNSNVQQVANHACARSDSDGEWRCNKDGEPQLRTRGREFGPGSGKVIDSSRPFNYAQRFDVTSSNELQITTTITQGRRQVVMTMGPGSAELNAMLSELQKGMAFVTGYWYAEDMSGLDSEVCGNGPQHCNLRPAFVSNWTINSN